MDTFLHKTKRNSSNSYNYFTLAPTIIISTQAHPFSPSWHKIQKWVEATCFIPRVKCTILAVPLGFDTQNLTQLLLQPFSADSWLKPYPLVNVFSIVTSLGQWLPMQTKIKVLASQMEAPQARRLFLRWFWQRRKEMANPIPTKAFLQPSPEAAMLFAPFGCTHPPPSVQHFLLAQI